jgi:hypothetical protein
MEKDGYGDFLRNLQAAIVHEYDLPESYHAHDAEYDDESEYDEDEDEDNYESEYDDEDEDWDHQPDAPVGLNAIAFADGRRGRLTVRDGRSNGRSHAGWKLRLTRVSEYATTRAAAERVASRDAGKQRQAWFAVSIAECLAGGRLIVYFRQRETRQTGDLREQSPIEVPYSGRDALLDALYRLPTLPEIELPPALRVNEIVGTPQGRLEIQSPEKHAYYSSRGQLYANVHFVYGDHSFDWENQEGGALVAEDLDLLLS